MQSQGLNSNYFYQLMHINNSDEIPSQDNSRTEPNPSQETAPVGYQLSVQGCPAVTPDTAAGGRKAPAPGSGLPTFATTYTQPAAQLLGRGIFLLLHL